MAEKHSHFVVFCKVVCGPDLNTHMAAEQDATLARQLSASLDKGTLNLASLTSIDLASFLQQLSKQNSLPNAVGSLDFAEFINQLAADPEERERIARTAALATTSQPAVLPPPPLFDTSVSELVNNHA